MRSGNCKGQHERDVQMNDTNSQSQAYSGIQNGIANTISCSH
ncbi:hypothetical protein CLOSTMETH_03350 [[Clostridium] methylpentosum DSM 5476]|uniref:Uncharacterized protein n=1 Tax=[Clostridium] methylpentosum DSM 5476 TaxID=537013 RepID=C0EHK5_9FIRM|nr:hypothetical protein CLOSTMETH_03350 [[Clostridium] methylpentosum DSM 5476]